MASIDGARWDSSPIRKPHFEIVTYSNEQYIREAADFETIYL